MALSNKSPHFFKIILQETLLDGKIEIPKEFINKYGKCMSTPAAFLRVPSGEVWKIEVRKSDGNVWLRKGWRQFSNHYSLKRGQFVVFSYEGKCNFDVVIMDTTASEIQYPYTRNYVMHNSKKFPEMIESESEDDIPPTRKSREKSSDLPCPRPHKKMRSSDSADYITETNLKSVNNGCTYCRNKKLKDDKKAFALRQAITGFKSENPFFVVVMQPSYVGIKGKCRLHIPEYFVKRHLMKEDCEIALCNSDGKTWSVHFHQGGGNGKKVYGCLYIGWGNFVHDNNIQVGDVCAFELINCIQISFKVTIFQGGDGNPHKSSAFNDVFHVAKGNAGASCNPSQGKATVKRMAGGCCDSLNALQKAKALQLARAFKSENPSFTLVLQPSYVHTSRVCIPENFAKRYFKNMQTNMHHEVLLCVSDEKWPVKYYQHPNIGRNANFRGTGWRQFVLDNDLEVGNVCVFELVTEFSFKVTIYRKQAIEGANLGSSSAKSGANVVKIECDEGLEINAESNPLQHKGDVPICNMQNQHLTGETCNANDGGDKSDDFWLSLITETPGKVLKEAGENPTCRTKLPITQGTETVCSSLGRKQLTLSP